MATNAQINRPYSVAVDNVGNVYLADTANYRIRKIDATGTVTTIAGTGSSGYDGEGLAATNSQVNYPKAVDVDDAGNVYIGDSANYRVRKIDVGGVLTTIAGTNMFGYTGDGGPATAARINQPVSVDVDDAGNVYLADYGNNRIRRVDAASGIITTVAGNGVSGYSGDGGAGTNASLALPHGVTVGGATLYISDTDNNRVRIMTGGTALRGTPSSADRGDNPVRLEVTDGITDVRQDFTIHVAPAATGLVITAVTSLTERASGACRARVIYSDGGTSDVTTVSDWALVGSPPAGTVFDDHVLTAGSVDTNTTIRIRAAYTQATTTLAATSDVVVIAYPGLTNFLA